MFNKNRSAALGFIFVTVLIDVIGFGIIIPVIPSLIQKLTGGDMSVASRYGGFSCSHMRSCNFYLHQFWAT